MIHWLGEPLRGRHPIPTIQGPQERSTQPPWHRSPGLQRRLFLYPGTPFAGAPFVSTAPQTHPGVLHTVCQKGNTGMNACEAMFNYYKELNSHIPLFPGQCKPGS